MLYQIVCRFNRRENSRLLYQIVYRFNQDRGIPDLRIAQGTIVQGSDLFVHITLTLAIRRITFLATIQLISIDRTCGKCNGHNPTGG